MRGTAGEQEVGVAIEPSEVGNVAARLMDTLEDKYGDDAEIKAVLLLVDVSHSDGTRDTIEYAPSEGLALHEGVGMLEVVKHHLLSG